MKGLKWKTCVALAIIVAGLFGGFAVETVQAQPVIITETPICTESSAQAGPTIYGDLIVWQDLRSGNWDIYTYDLSTNTETQITTDTTTQQGARIYGDLIVWTDWRNNQELWNQDIYMYDLSTNTETQITTDTAHQASCAIYGNLIVWEDWRNNNKDIYLGEISLTPTPSPAIEQAENIKSIIEDPFQIPTDDFEGANDQVRNGRRGSLGNRLEAVIMDIQTAEASTDPSTINTAYQSAIDQLNSILDKTDGCAERGTPDTPSTPGETPDWIATCESQAQIDPLIRDLITTLEDLLIP